MIDLKPLPHDRDSETAVLSCLLRDPELIPQAVTLVGQAMYLPANRLILQTLESMYADGGIIDPVLLMSGLRNQEAFEEVGGARYVAELIDDLPMLSSFEQYCKSVRDKADYRKVIADAERVTMEAYEATEPATALAGKLADSANEILDRANTSSTSRSWGEVAAATMAIIEERYNGDHGTPGFPWPLRDLNELTNGIQKKKVTVIAARPGDGKTAFAGQVINHLASNGVSCGVCSTEMPAEDLMMRNFAAASGISSMKLERGLIGKTEFPILEKTADKVARLPIQVDDRASPTIEEIEVIARTWKRDHDLQVLAVDYLQILQGAKDSWSKEDKVSRLMAGLLRIAKKLDIAIILLSQLSRGSGGEDKRPTLDRLRDSGAIEQDAHGVVFIYPDPRRHEWPEEPAYEVEIIVAKWRNGRIGSFDAEFHKATTTFREKRGE